MAGIDTSSGYSPQDRRLAEEIRAAAGDLVNRIGQQGSMA
jgi:hypothetical protein